MLLLFFAVVNCGDYILLPHADYITYNGILFNHTVSVQCDPGFLPQDIITATCTAAGQWDTDPPNCTAGM